MKTVKDVENEAGKGMRALENAINAINEGLKVLLLVCNVLLTHLNLMTNISSKHKCVGTFITNCNDLVQQAAVLKSRSTS